MSNEGVRIQTHSGRMVDPLKITAADVELDDVAQSLSHLCRFTGHTSAFYSVAEHSVICSCVAPKLLPADERFAPLAGFVARLGLLHDAHEAYLGDIATPLKRFFPGLDDVKARVDAAIFERFGLATTAAVLSPETLKVCHEAVAKADAILLSTEKRHVLKNHAVEWNAELPEPLPNTRPLMHAPNVARRVFLAAFTLHFGGWKP
jgi:5'-deoxynucleotidase YfbR-like HD superfamily hydrolase